VPPETIHASAARVGERGVLIRGAPGSGKSSLLMALIFGETRATLVADDRVVLSVAGGRLLAAPPESIAGRMEVRGVGIIDLPYVSPAAIALVVDLVPLSECPRLPDESEARVVLHGAMLRRIFVAIGAADAAYRVRAALAVLSN
jgi:serine kinase of HPr protein (carbohydrate metabolism regulator)